jgi:hypothetical protein
MLSFFKYVYFRHLSFDILDLDKKMLGRISYLEIQVRIIPANGRILGHFFPGGVATSCFCTERLNEWQSETQKEIS